MLKKVYIFALCLFSFMGICFAANKYDSKLYVKETNVKKGEKFDLDVYLEAKDFRIYAVLFTLDYNKKNLELVDVKGANNFDVTKGDSILADRIEIPKKDDNKLLTLTFKVKKSGNETISFKSIKAANMEEEISLDDVSVKVGKSSSMGITCAIIAVAVIAGCGVAIIAKKKKIK